MDYTVSTLLRNYTLNLNSPAYSGTKIKATTKKITISSSFNDLHLQFAFFIWNTKRISDANSTGAAPIIVHFLFVCSSLSTNGEARTVGVCRSHQAGDRWWLKIDANLQHISTSTERLVIVVCRGTALYWECILVGPGNLRAALWFSGVFTLRWHLLICDN